MIFEDHGADDNKPVSQGSVNGPGDVSLGDTSMPSMLYGSPTVNCVEQKMRSVAAEDVDCTSAPEAGGCSTAVVLTQKKFCLSDKRMAEQTRLQHAAEALQRSSASFVNSGGLARARQRRNAGSRRYVEERGEGPTKSTTSPPDFEKNGKKTDAIEDNDEDHEGWMGEHEDPNEKYFYQLQHPKRMPFLFYSDSPVYASSTSPRPHGGGKKSDTKTAAKNVEVEPQYRRKLQRRKRFLSMTSYTRTFSSKPFVQETKQSPSKTAARTAPYPLKLQS
ncbi:unnamed protein product [Amoebophrya sp. A120]|nr:unnamed protein product [Amoebophrya sp. A120]|eukprot:GSA120T00003582001.1